MIDTVIKFEVNIVNGSAIFEAIDQVKRRTANTLDRRQAKLHRPRRHLDRLRSKLESARVCAMRVFDAKRKPASARSVLGSEIGGETLRLTIDDEVGIALTVQIDRLRAVTGNQRESHLLEQGLE